MAKQRQPQTRSSRAASGSPRQPQLSSAAPAVSSDSAAPAPAAAPKPPERRSTYVDAVALYEQGLERLQRHDYSAAAERVGAVPRSFPGGEGAHKRGRP